MRLAMTMMGALALAGCTASAEMQASDQARAEKDLAEALKGRTAGAPVDCIDDTILRGPQVIDENTLLYTAGRRVFRAELEAQCRGLTQYDTLVVERFGSQLCRNDRFRVLPSGSRIPGAYCRFGKFTPYTKP